MTTMSVWILALFGVVHAMNVTQTTRIIPTESENPSNSGRGKPSWKEIARNKSKLVSQLLKGYDKRIRPYTGGSTFSLEGPLPMLYSSRFYKSFSFFPLHPVNVLFTDIEVQPMDVRVDMLVSNIWAIEEARMDFTIDIYLRQYWKDPRLSFMENKIQKTLTLNRQTIDEIWVPSTYFFNAKKAYFHDVTTDNYLLQIQRDGNIFYSVRLTVTMACKLNLQMFPHDVQTCTVMVESYGYQATDVYYRWNSRNSTGDVVYIAEDLEMPQFMITNVELEERTNIYNIGPHSALVAKFTFHRRLGYYMIQTYIPSMLTVTISWFSFWISPDSPPARVGLGITTVLTMITISNSARAPLPKVSYTKAIDWFLLMCLVYVFGALMEYAIVNFYSCKVQYKRQKDTRKAEQQFLEQESEKEDKDNSLLNGSLKKGESNGNYRLAVVVDSKNPFFPRGQLHKKHPKFRFSRRPRQKERDDVDENDSQPPKRHHHYFWDPYETAFMTSEPAYTVDKYARIYFPVTFAVLNSIYWIVYAPDKVIF